MARDDVKHRTTILYMMITSRGCADVLHTDTHHPELAMTTKYPRNGPHPHEAPEAVVHGVFRRGPANGET